MVVLNSSSLTDGVDEASLACIHNTIIDRVTYKKEDVANLLDVLFQIEKRNENEIPHTIHRDDTEEIDLNNSSSSIEYLEDVETNHLNHFKTGEDTLPNNEIVVDLNNSTSSIDCLEDTLPNNEIVDLTKSDVYLSPTKAKDVFKYKKCKRNLKQRQHRLMSMAMSENCSTIFRWQNSQVLTKKSKQDIHTFFYKNTVYKNIEPHIRRNLKNIFIA